MKERITNFLHWIVEPLDSGISTDKVGDDQSDKQNIDVSITVEELTIESDDE